MTRRRAGAAAALLADPFGERSPGIRRERVHLLGGTFEFESDSPRLLRLVEWAYAGLPRHRLSTVTPHFRIRLVLRSDGRSRGRLEPPPMAMHSGAGLLCGATESSNYVVMSPAERAALVVVSQRMLRSPYHARYELIEFAVFTLAARAQGLVPLHAACVGRGGRGLLLVGPSGSGKSTVALHSLLNGFDFLSEDSVFVQPDTMRATGVANFLHVRADSLRFLAAAGDVGAIRKSPVIRRRSGVEKFEVDLRGSRYRLAAVPLKIAAVVRLSAERARKERLVVPVRSSSLIAELRASQPYAARQPGWSTFGERVASLASFELRRGSHPRESVHALQELLKSDPG